MTINKLMQKKLVTCLPSTSIHDIAAKMKDHQVGSILVVEDGGKLKGIVTDRDIALSVGDARDLGTTYASDIMTSDPVTIGADADFESALKTMRKENIRRLPVVQNGQLVGLLSSADVATEIKEEFDQFIGLEEAFAKH